MIVTLSFAATAVAEQSQELFNFESEQQRRIYAQLTAELRCPQCQNQNIADSNAVVAVDMREKTHELVLQGYNRQQVLDYMIDRYGNFVHYQPPVNSVTIWLWLLPVLMLVALFLFQLRRRRNVDEDDSTSSEVLSETATKAAQQKALLSNELDHIIERYRSKKL
ncbi:cytochrome c-type biogenesis protein [Alishewanella longhuensis]|uniref:cytochrome c-type biogenesis protein n=1 Tax=Alishewanella longhuensis TaxID=1091037 RepID=UPI001E551A0B|nr:cytochrome c-type biogenesis protein [Alishewanella longhuensis]